ncbi:unnamed protein product [Heligmosomoides polygyrus]|uniref:Transposase n=1 Tax=Heligmosomoides polygyrus TaxID=6339 RepID=A0A183GKS6_HELPZ|nr:unnamed protein product [Heligmosomoides polygyrus]
MLACNEGGWEPAQRNGDENAALDGWCHAFGSIADKLREARLRLYGHVLRADGDTVRKIGLNIDVPGKRPKGRPRQRWLDTLHLDLKEAGIHPDQAFHRAKWRHHTRRADTAAKREKAEGEEEETNFS